MRKLILSFFILALTCSALYFAQKSEAAVITTIAPAGTPLSTQNGPLWNYPTNSVGCKSSRPEPYVYYTFDITASGSYTFTMNPPSGISGRIYVYHSLFNPNNKCGNILNNKESDNDYIAGNSVALTLSASSSPARYIVVFTAQNVVVCPNCPNQSIIPSNVNGTFSATVSGPAAVTLVPNVSTTIVGAGTPLSPDNNYTWQYPVEYDCGTLSGTVPFVAQKIRVSASGLYTFNMNTSGFPGVIHLYTNNFYLDQPCLNLASEQDPNGFVVTGNSVRIPISVLTPVIVAVFSPRNPGDTGTFSASVTGPAPVTVLSDPLSIVSQPSSKSVTSGCRQTLTVYATGPTPQTFQWYDGIAGDLSTSILIHGATSNTYTTPTLTSDKSYWVRVTNGSKHVDSQTIAFKVYQTNKTQFNGSLDDNQTWNLMSTYCNPSGTFVHYSATQISIPTSSSYNITVNKGGNFSGGYAIHVYTGAFNATTPCFSFDALSINSGLTTHLSSGTHTVVISATTPTELDGDYSVSISTNDDCSLPETLEQALIISGNPLDKAITPGNTATLTFAYTGGTSTAKTIQWYKGFSGDTSQPIAGATTTTYTTPTLNQLSPPYYYYWARVNDQRQTTHADTRTAVVNVLNQPITYSDVLSQCDEVYPQVNGPITYYKIFPFNVSTDGQYTFNVSATGFTPAVRLYQNFFIPAFPNLGYYGPGNTQTILAGPNTNYLVITSTQAFQTGSFTVTITGPALVVPTPRPILTSQPANQIVFRDQTTTLSASSSTPDVSYQWFTGTCTNKTPVSGANSSTYTTPPMTDYKDYWVKVSYGVMYVNSNIARISIRPQAISDTYTIDEDAQLNLAAPGVLANDKKADSKTLTPTAGSITTLGSRFLATNGSLTYVPINNLNGTDSFTYTVTDGTLSSTAATVTVIVREINDPPVRTAGSITTHTFDEDSAGSSLHLAGLAYGPGGGTDEASQQLIYKVTAVPPANVGSITLDDNTTVVTTNTVYTLSQIRGMTFKPAANGYGTHLFTFTVTDNGTSRGAADPQFLTESLSIIVNGFADTPSATNATTNEDTKTTAGLVLSRNAADGAEVGYFKIGQIRNGTLYKGDGITQINNDQFITYAEGQAGLKFSPTANLFSRPDTTFSFQVQASLTSTNQGLGGSAVTATITVNPVAEPPFVTGAATFANLQTSSGLVITRNPGDGPEIGYYKISSITNGKLYKSDGTTQISEGQFISVTDGAAGLRFTPAQDSSAQGSFTVQGSADTSGNGLGPAATATITVSKYDTSTTITSTSPSPSLAGQQVTVNYNVVNTSSGPAPLGNVTVTLSGGGETCTGTATAASCTLTLTNSGNPRTITAAYGGNSQFNSSTGTIDHVVNAPAITYVESSGNCGVDQTPCFTSIQAAMAAGGSGSTVNILGGTFNENVDLNTNLTVNVNGDTAIGSLSMSAGTLNGGSFILALSNGNWTNNGGAFNPGAGTVSFTGSGQTIGGSNPTTFNNLTIGAGGTTVNGAASKSGNTVPVAGNHAAAILVDETVTGVLALTGDLTVTSPARLIMTASATSTGNGDVIGNLLRQGFVTGACASAPCANTLSLGNPDNQLTFTGGTAPESVLVNLTKSAPPTYASAVQRSYDITQTGGSNFTATLRLHYLDSELNGHNEANLNLRRFDGSWQSVLPSVVNTTTNWVESNAVTGFSQLTLATLAPTAADGAVSGRIYDSNGNPVEGAAVRMNGTQNRLTVTDALGQYRFDDVETHGFYTVTPARANYSFSPSNRSFSQLGNHTEASFSGSFGGDNLNPLDTPEYFVRQQYVDMLGREPDEGGFNYWSNEIRRCGGDAACTNARRRDIAAAFFMEKEFQDSGSYIYDAYKGALGRKPVFSEYSVDRKKVVGGPDLNTQKAAFADGFVQRVEFVTKYQTNITADGFVDALLATASQSSGVDLSSLRAGLISKYQSGGNMNQGRSLVLQELADSAALKAAEYNAAFVLMEYFNYLRRNPEQEGFDFWLNVLNGSAGGDTGVYARMVCAFITSTEYQQRFSKVVSHGNGECAP